MTATCRTVIVAGTHSGVGKTTVALALMAALRRRGLVVQPFKAGPDFIDPGHHSAVCGRPSYNLDTWMLTEDAVRATLTRASAGADVAVIEGVMGLFDGRGPDDPRGSTAHLAKLLAVPVVLVVDAEGMAASVAALVKGFADFDADVSVIGVICNRVAGPRHYDYLAAPIRRHTRVAPLGWLPREQRWEIASRHLGLVTQQDWQRHGAGFDVDSLGKAFEASVDVDSLLQRVSRLSLPAPTPPVPMRTPTRRVALAQDSAFCFYYQENLDLLQAAGAEIVPFSPLRDHALPGDIDLIYLGGGYPELSAATLAGNEKLMADLREYHQQGGAIYAECGGLMYCCRELVDGAGRAYPMLGLLPARTVMQGRLAALGYVTWRGTAPSLLGPVGTEVRGHEYHYSRLEPLGKLSPAALLHRDGGQPKADGFEHGSLLAGYAHLHFASQPALAAHLLAMPRSP